MSEVMNVGVMNVGQSHHPIKSLKGHKSLGSLCGVVKTLIVSGAGQTRCPIELFWTAKNSTRRPLTQTHMYTDSRADLCQA